MANILLYLWSVYNYLRVCRIVCKIITEWSTLKVSGLSILIIHIVGLGKRGEVLIISLPSSVVFSEFLSWKKKQSERVNPIYRNSDNQIIQIGEADSVRRIQSFPVNKCFLDISFFTFQVSLLNTFWPKSWLYCKW